MPAPDPAPPERIAAAMRACHLAGCDHYVPVIRALGEGRIAFQAVHHGTTPGEVSAALRQVLPVVAVVGDDDGVNAGPSGFPAARRLLRDVGAVMVHGAGGEVHHYESAIGMAQIVRSVAIVETSSAKAEEWLSVALRCALPRRVPTLLILPRNGGVHPVAPAWRQ